MNLLRLFRSVADDVRQFAFGTTLSPHFLQNGLVGLECGVRVERVRARHLGRLAEVECVVTDALDVTGDHVTEERREETRDSAKSDY